MTSRRHIPMGSTPELRLTFARDRKVSRRSTAGRGFLSSFVIRSVDREAVRRAVEDLPAGIYTAPRSGTHVWFGLWMHGTPTPGSDVELCLVLPHSEKPLRDRILNYLPFSFPHGTGRFSLYARGAGASGKPGRNGTARSRTAHSCDDKPVSHRELMGE